MSLITKNTLNISKVAVGDDISNSASECPILLVEDNQDDVLITKRAWNKGRIRNKLYVVNDGEEALEFLFKQGEYSNAPTPGLMLLDLKMPRVDGFEVLTKIKQDTKLKVLPIIVLTTSNRDQDIQRAYSLGCNSYILKPVSYEKFIEAVNTIKKYWMTMCEIPLTSSNTP
jgi:CheY-like chemotaxis protein